MTFYPVSIRGLVKQLCAHAVLVSLLCGTSAHASEEPLTIALLPPDAKGNRFWDMSVDFARSVADDLDIDLRVMPIRDDATSYIYLRDGLEFLREIDSPDYITTIYAEAVTKGFLDYSSENDIPFFIFNTAIADSEQEKIGLPRGKYKDWIGHIHPDDVKAGYQLMDALVRDFETNMRGEINVIALNGAKETAVSFDRNFGLEKRADTQASINLQEIAYCRWEEDVAYQDTLTLLAKYPETNVIWAASDVMALAAIRAVKSLDKVPGQDILIGGMDWTTKGLESIAAGEMTASVGGHFMEAGWSLIMLHDYHHGIDFAQEIGTRYVTAMQVITANNVDRYLDRFGDRDWGDVDFSKFSKEHNPALKGYDFSIKALLEN